MSNPPPIDHLRRLAEARDSFFEQFDRLAETISDELEQFRQFDFSARPGETAAQAFERVAHPLKLTACDGDSPTVRKLIQRMRESRLDLMGLLVLLHDELPQDDRERLRGLRPAGQPVIARADELRQPQRTKRREKGQVQQ